MPTLEELLAKYQEVQNYELSPKSGTKHKYEYAAMTIPISGGGQHSPSYVKMPGYKGSIDDPDNQESYTEYNPDFNKLTQMGKETQSALQAELANREQQAQDTLVQRRDEANTAIDAQLKKLLEESGVQGGIAREQTGASYAGNGLLRSTAASGAIEDVSNQELSQKSQYQLDAYGKKQGVNNFVNDALTQLKDAKEQRKLNQTLASIKQAEEFRSQANLSDIERSYRQSLFDLDLSRQEYEQHTALFSGILGGAAQILAFSA